MGFSVGIGLTNDCNLSCPHCYRDAGSIEQLTLAHIATICAHLPVDAMGFGTGENALNPEFPAILELLHARGVRLSLASNGYSLMALDDAHLRMFHDVELSLDFATETRQNRFRVAGNWALVHAATARCRALAVPVSILATLMSVNYQEMPALVALARQHGVHLRVNAYQSVKTDEFRLSYAQFWHAYRALFATAEVVSCAEPVVRAAMGLADAHSPCAHTSIRFNPHGQVIPCVYWPTSEDMPTIADLPRLGATVLQSRDFAQARRVPPRAATCKCQGGCASRRALAGQLDAHDAYCPWVRGDDMRLDWQPAPAVDLMRARNVCTTIVR